MTNIAPLAQVSSNVDTVAKFVRVIAKEGVTIEQLNLPVNSRPARRNLAAFLAAGCPKITLPNEEGVSKLATPYDLATMILGRDFISPEEIAAKYSSIVYAKYQLDAFESTLPSREDLEWLRDNRFILVPGPNIAMSLLDVRNLNTAHFYSGAGSWYASDDQVFSRNDKTEVRWIAFRKGAVRGSFGKTWEEHKALLYGFELVPNAAEAVWCMTAYRVVRNISLFRSEYVRTASLESMGGPRIILGGFDGNGIHVEIYWDRTISDNVGVASARKF